MFNDFIVKKIENFGELSLRPLNIAQDNKIIRPWLNHKQATFWGMENYSLEKITAFYQTLEQDEHQQAYIGYYNNEAAFLIECYQPKFDAVSQVYAVQEGDMGMHILLAPTNNPIKNFSIEVMRFVMSFIFEQLEAIRIVVEPDENNHKIHRLNTRVGFSHDKKITLGDKQALLGFCHHLAFARANEVLELVSKHSLDSNQQDPKAAYQQLNPAIWLKANTLHLKKILSELCHERLLTPTIIGTENKWTCYQLTHPENTISYTFNAQLMQLNHWYIDEQSIEKLVSGEVVSLDSVEFILEFNQQLAIPQVSLATYLEEVSSTLLSSCYKLNKAYLTAQNLSHATFQQVEREMFEGHPAFIANNGRIGFGVNDYQRYAPEVATPLQLIWLAAHKDNADFVASHDLNYQTLIEQELDLSLRQHFQRQLVEQGLLATEYFLIPVHPWQWQNKLVHIFVNELANKRLVCLGYGNDHYLAQQSIRTFYNVSNQQKYYVKTALSIQNMGFMRGLSTEYMRSTPAINDWINQLVLQDDYLQSKQFTVLREVAATGYNIAYYDNDIVGNTPYKKMLASLWRENPHSKITEQQNVMTMAALLHIDPEGDALLPHLIETSALTTHQWLNCYLDAYFIPLIHCFYQHQVVFMPHGENIILVMENNVPVKVLIKDIGEEICLLNSEKELPKLVSRIKVSMTDEMALLYLFTDIFDSIFRYLSQILYQFIDYSEHTFWQTVAAAIIKYQQDNPQLQKQFERYDLFQADFKLSCLNRLQLGNNKQMFDITDPANSQKFSGVLINPIAEFKAIAPITNVKQSIQPIPSPM